MWLKYNHIFGEIILKLGQEDTLKFRTICEEFSKLFKNRVKIKTIKFSKTKDLDILSSKRIIFEIIKKYNILEVKLCYTNISNKNLSYLSNCIIIDLYGCRNITDEGLIYLSNCEIIDLGFTIITDKGLKYLINCHTFYLEGCREITDEMLNYLSISKTIIFDRYM